MSTIPTTSKRIRISYTALGETEKPECKNRQNRLSLLVLNRGKSIFKTEFFKEIESLGFSQVISIENPGVNYELETVARKFPFVKFLLLHESCSAGEQINIGIEEAREGYVYVIWNDMKPSHSSLSARLFENLEKENCLCTVPVIKPHISGETVPSIVMPAFQKKILKMIYTVPKNNGVISLFPFDYCGIYNREKFLSTGGYDYSILNQYWQKMDFGFRSNMWGEKIVCYTSLQASYTSDVIGDDTSIDKYYRIFFLKNLAVRFNGDSGYLPWSKFLQYYLRSGEGFFVAKKNFNEAKKWVELNKFRFNLDCRSLTELWADPEK
ncbi:MAG: hypothetical protein FWC36_06670 [Spirochaetes bacterium]|nr:hypothetical protein [Spirochaetota bacterium]